MGRQRRQVMAQLVAVALGLGLLASCKVAVTDNVTVAAGGAHTCAIKIDGTVQCWGSNASLQLGASTADGSHSLGADSPTPILVGGITDAQALAAGPLSTCVVHQTGTLSCWGSNASGAIGLLYTDYAASPTPVPGVSGASGVSLGATHGCAPLTDGTARCWGSNSYGKLGDGSGDGGWDQQVRVVAGLGDVAALDAGADHTCARRTNGTVTCWGRNTNGQLGNGTTTNGTTPVTVTGLTDATDISAGDDHTCARRTNGTVTCWGRNTNGQLGNGTTTDSTTPVTVTGLTDATDLSAGGAHTCAVTADTTIDCWGANSSGALGDRTAVDAPSPVTTLRSPRLAPLETVSVGRDHACAVREAGGGAPANTVWCWGAQGAFDMTTTPVQIAGLTDVTDLSSGTGTCAVRADTTVVCWGYRFDGPATSSPTAVAGLSGVTQVDVGFQHACARLADGTVRCWGRGTSGELGNGGTSTSAAPVAVSGLTGVVDVTTSYEGTCAVRTDGTVWCWGRYSVFNGGGYPTNSSVPVQWPGLTNAVAVESSDANICALLVDGTVRCWGWSPYTFGQVPVPIAGVSGATSLSAGKTHWCAQVPSGARCWGGSNTSGQLGVSAGPVLTAAAPRHLGPTLVVAAGGDSSCAILPNHEATCWGEGWSGQLGNGTRGGAAYAGRPVVTAL